MNKSPVVYNYLKCKQKQRDTAYAVQQKNDFWL